MFDLKNIEISFGDILFKWISVANNENQRPEFPILHTHDFYEIQIARKGSYTVWFPKSKLLCFNEGEMLPVPPKREHFTYLLNDSISQNILISFGIEKTEGYPKICDYFTERIETDFPAAQKVSDELVRLSLEVTSDPRESMEDYIAAKCRLTALFGRLLCDLGINEKGAAELPDSETGHENPLTEEYVGDFSMSLADIAGRIGYSERNTSRLIKEKYGMTLTDFRRERRIEMAERLIKEMPEIGIEQICAALGYNSKRLFYQEFKTKYGCTPAEYRRSIEHSS